MARVFLVCLSLVCAVTCVYGHGRLLEPASRASAFRKGFNNPADFNDNQGWCGGFNVQHKENGGKCGVCGDPFNGKRLHEPGPDNVYANGIITGTYSSGQTISVTVEITAAHKGFMNFKLCPNNDATITVTQECLDIYPLADANGNTKFAVTEAQTYIFQLQLPLGVSCDACVLQWRYHTGNSDGCCDSNGNRGLGLGDQEEFYACADIKILDDESVNPPAVVADTNPPAVVAPNPPAVVVDINPPAVAAQSNTLCAATGSFEGVEGMDQWCLDNCPVNCPSTHCNSACSNN